LYGPWIYGWSRRLGLSPEDGADVTQETLIAVHRSIGEFQANQPGATFRGWVWSILRHKLLDQRRRIAARDQATGGSQAQERLAQVPDQPPDETATAGPSELRALLHRGLAQVRPEFEDRTWQAFWSVVVDGRTPAEVAAEIGISPAAVRQAKSRILRRLREYLGDKPS
jgi:RNA polymerase sigma-70 factor (ECF subfamily)